MKRNIFSIILALVFIINGNAHSHTFRPLIEEGKEWHYRYKIGFMWDFAPEKYPDYYVTLKMQGDTVIDNLTYKKVYSYTGDNKHPDNGTPFGFMREDCDNRKIYARSNPSYDFSVHRRMYYFSSDAEYIVFDFDHPENSAFEHSDSEIYNPTVFKSYGVDYHGYVWETPGGSRTYVEGLGLISTDIGSDIFGEMFLISGGQGYLSYIYCIKDGSGNTLFYDQSLGVDASTFATYGVIAITRAGDKLILSAGMTDIQEI